MHVESTQSRKIQGLSLPLTHGVSKFNLTMLDVITLHALDDTR